MENESKGRNEGREGEGSGWGKEPGTGRSGFMDGFVPDVIKRLFVAGLGAVFASEEGIRRLATEFSLPKEMAGYLVSQAQATKNELFRIVAGEVRGFLESINLGAELKKILTSLTFEVKMQIRLLPSDDEKGIRPDIRGAMKVIQDNKASDENPSEQTKREG